MEVEYIANEHERAIKISLSGYSEAAAADVESCAEEVFALLQSYCETVEKNIQTLDSGGQNSRVGAALLMKARAFLTFSLETSRSAASALNGDVRGSEVGFPEFDEE